MYAYANGSLAVLRADWGALLLRLDKECCLLHATEVASLLLSRKRKIVCNFMMWRIDKLRQPTFNTGAAVAHLQVIVRFVFCVLHK